MTSSDRPPRSVEEYLARLGERLGPLPEADRREILEETRGHLADRYADVPPERAAEHATRELGTPEEYAAAFLENYGVVEGAASPAAPGRGARVATFVGVALLATVAATMFLFGLIQILTPPWAESVWFIWRDVGLGDYGWLLLALASWSVAAGAAIAARALVRRGGPSAG
jgi:hypothetical protein